MTQNQCEFYNKCNVNNFLSVFRQDGAYVQYIFNWKILVKEKNKDALKDCQLGGLDLKINSKNYVRILM